MSDPTFDDLLNAAEMALEDHPPDPNAVELALIARSLIGKMVTVEQARAIALNARAEAWEEGWETGMDYCHDEDDSYITCNPYSEGVIHE